MLKMQDHGKNIPDIEEMDANTWYIIILIFTNSQNRMNNEIDQIAIIS